MGDSIERSGESLEEAIVIRGAEDSLEGVPSEHEYLMSKFGKPGEDWILDRQGVGFDADRCYDLMTLRFPDGSKKTVRFDITSFYTKTSKPVHQFADILKNVAEEDRRKPIP